MFGDTNAEWFKLYAEMAVPSFFCCVSALQRSSIVPDVFLRSTQPLSPHIAVLVIVRPGSGPVYYVVEPFLSSIFLGITNT